MPQVHSPIPKRHGQGSSSASTRAVGAAPTEEEEQLLLAALTRDRRDTKKYQASQSPTREERNRAGKVGNSTIENSGTVPPRRLETLSRKPIHETLEANKLTVTVVRQTPSGLSALPDPRISFVVCFMVSYSSIVFFVEIFGESY